MSQPSFHFTSEFETNEFAFCKHYRKLCWSISISKLLLVYYPKQGTNDLAFLDNLIHNSRDTFKTTVHKETTHAHTQEICKLLFTHFQLKAVS